MRFPACIVITVLILLDIAPMFAGETAPCDPAKHYRVWLRPFGNWTQGETTSADDLQFVSYGLTLGLDRQIGNNWLCGLALGENNTSIKFAHSLYKDDINAFHADLFARRTFDRFFLDVESNFGYNEHAVQKNAAQWGLSGEWGTWWSHGLGKVEPYIRLSHVYWNGSGSDTKETLIAGVRYSWRTATDLTTTIPRFYGGVLQELGGKSLFQVSSFGNTPTVFPVRNVEVPGTRLFLGGGFTTSMGTSLDIFLRYTAEMSSRDTSHTALLGVNCNF
jgi:outer membrane autotransporter protein